MNTAVKAASGPETYSHLSPYADHADGHGHDGHGHHAHPTPLSRLIGLMATERSDLTLLIVYTIVAGLLALIVPLTAQALVNTIAANVLIQPLFVLTGLVLGSLLLVGALQIAKMRLVEVLQQRVFARTALDMAYHLIRVRASALRDEYAPEVVNRFFDVLTVQKALSKLLLDGMAALLQAVIGLTLLGFYSPWLLGFDVILLAFVGFIIGILGWRGLRSSIEESKEKYRVADWLEEIARCHVGFKLHGDAPFLVGRADDLIVGYLRARQGHFAVNLRQATGHYLFQALASAGILALGGWLVISRQLTLGQLVAAQIVVVGLLAALEKLVRQADQVFDLLTGLDKIGHVLDLATERTSGHDFGDLLPGGATVRLRDVRFAYRPGYETLSGLSLTVASGERVCLVGASGAGKTTLSSLLCGLEEPSQGVVEVGGIDVRERTLGDLRRLVSRVGDVVEIFDGTVEDNVTVGREHLTHEQVRRALEIAQFSDEIARMPLGMQTPLVSGGQNLSRGQAQRLLIARAIVGEPRLLILDEATTGIDETTARTILDTLLAPGQPWTVLAISHDADVASRCNRVIVLDGGQIVEDGDAKTLTKMPSSKFCALFPSLADSLRGREPAKVTDAVPATATEETQTK